MRKLITTLNTIGVEVECSVSDLNFGGCAVFAAIIAERLTNLNVEVEVIEAWDAWSTLSGEGKFDINKARQKILKKRQSRLNINNWITTGASFFHVGVRFKHNDVWYTYDSKGVRRAKTRLSGMSLSGGAYTVDEIKSFAGKSTGWNPMFDRKQIPIIRKIVNNYFAKLAG